MGYFKNNIFGLYVNQMKITIASTCFSCVYLWISNEANSKTNSPLEICASNDDDLR